MKFIKSNPKVFCIGLNKTGTTALGAFLEQQGLSVEKQVNGERMLNNYLNRDFNTIIKSCRKSKNIVFQDVPYSLPYTYMHLDNAFPSAKFILTVRDSPEQWYQSILGFHSNKFNNGQKPDKEALLKSKYIQQGWAWNLMNDVFFHDKNDYYERSSFINIYNHHIACVNNYFRNTNKLITVNLSNNDDAAKVCEFLELKSRPLKFPKISSQDLISKNYKVKFIGN